MPQFCGMALSVSPEWNIGEDVQSIIVSDYTANKVAHKVCRHDDNGQFGYLCELFFAPACDLGD
jgi:hypothetical protein